MDLSSSAGLGRAFRGAFRGEELGVDCALDAVGVLGILCDGSSGGKVMPLHFKCVRYLSVVDASTGGADKFDKRTAAVI